VEYLGIEEDFDALAILGKEDKKDVSVNRALVHSMKIKFSLQSMFTLTKIPDPTGNLQVNVNKNADKWNQIKK
jgi:hypothetical protein